MNDEELQALALLVGGRVHRRQILIAKEVGQIGCDGCSLIASTASLCLDACPGTTRQWRPLNPTQPQPQPQPKE